MAFDLTYILKGYDLTNTQRVVYGVLDGLSKASAKRGKPYTYIGQKALAERVGVSPRTIYSALKRLQSVGLIVVRRRGQGRNNEIYIMTPSTVEKASCESRMAKIAVPSCNEKNLNNTDSKTIYPQSNNAALPQNKGKGRPTNKRPRRSIDERMRIKKRYRDYLIQKLKMNEIRNDVFSNAEEVKALEKAIELISNTMASKGKIMVNGCLLMPVQWWNIVRNIDRNALLELIYKIAETSNIRNYRAYFLAAIYNTGMENALNVPYYQKEIS